MKLDKFIFFLTSTVMIGSFMGMMTGLFNIFVDISWYSSVIEGGILATNCLMGFWAFLMLNFTSAMTLPGRVWKWAQVLIIVLVAYDMMFWRYHYAVIKNPTQPPSHLTFFLEGVIPLIVAIAAGFIKERLSGKGSFLPTVFFVYVFTVLDWLLVLKVHSDAIVNQTGFVILLCNVYMILIYGLLLSQPSSKQVGVTV